jgi:hypothetical protein
LAAILSIEKAMVVGILEFRSDRFINDVISRLSGITVEFISTSGERVPIERAYRVVVDRLSFQYPFLKEIVKGLSLNGTYVINNPFAASLTNKIVEIQLGTRLGLNFPRTMVLPDQSSTDETEGLVSQAQLDRVAEELGFPCILKPFDGYAWEDVYMVRSIEELRQTYHALCSRRVLLAQQLIKYRDYFRVFCFDKRDVLFIKWIPKPFAMGQYLHCDASSIGDVRDRLVELTTQLNQALDLDVNAVEWCVDDEGRWWVIDAFNEVPEVIPEALPPDCYAWIVDRFAACIRDKLDTGKRNRVKLNLEIERT